MSSILSSQRQDLVSMVTQLFKRSGDMVEITVKMGSDDMDNFVAFAGQKRAGSCAVKMAKEMNDLVSFCLSENIPIPLAISIFRPEHCRVLV